MRKSYKKAPSLRSNNTMLWGKGFLDWLFHLNSNLECKTNAAKQTAPISWNNKTMNPIWEKKATWSK